MTYTYAFNNYEKDHMAKVIGKGLPISTKQSIEVCKKIKGMPLNKARTLLERVVKKKEAIPYTRFNGDVGHKPGIGPGRYPLKTSEALLKLLASVEANAQFKGLNTADLIIEHICAQQGGKQWHYGRQRRRMMKRTHVEIVVKEAKLAEKPKEKKAPVAKEKIQSRISTTPKEKTPKKVATSEKPAQQPAAKKEKVVVEKLK